MPEIPSREAVEYGRKILMNEIVRLRNLQYSSRSEGEELNSLKWKAIADWIDNRILGFEGGCVITGFDVRWLDDSFRSAMKEVYEQVPNGKG